MRLRLRRFGESRFLPFSPRTAAIYGFSSPNVVATHLHTLCAVHFWAPIAKWLISIANISDLNKPADKLSVPQQGALAATGFIWSRYATQIQPFNVRCFSVLLRGAGLCVAAARCCRSEFPLLLTLSYRVLAYAPCLQWNLLAVNFTMGAVAAYQLSRAVRYQMDKDKSGAEDAAAAPKMQ